MEIIPIYPPHIYSIQYEGADENEFDRLFSLWNDMNYLTDFMNQNREYLQDPTWRRMSEPENAALQVLNEATDLEDLFDELNENTSNNEVPDFDSHFKYLEGKYKCEIVRPPMKSYGTGRPSLLRIYAIKLQPNLFIITRGGIKLARTIQDSPDLRDHVLQNIEKVRQYLRTHGIVDSNDLEY